MQLLFFILTILNVQNICLGDLLPVVDTLSLNDTTQRTYSFKTVERICNRLELSQGSDSKTLFAFKLATIINGNGTWDMKETLPIVKEINENFEHLLVLESMNPQKNNIAVRLQKGTIIMMTDIKELAGKYDDLLIMWRHKIFINKGFKLAILRYLNHNLGKMVYLKYSVLQGSSEGSVNAGYRILRHSDLALKAAIKTIEMVQNNTLLGLIRIIGYRFDELPAVEEEDALVDGIVEIVQNNVVKGKADPPELKFLIKGLKTITQGMVFLVLCVTIANVFCSVVFILTISVAVVVWIIIFWRMLNS
ncbi:uncharacterized protein NDAI_0F01140 [Naumovozyma dairenensis CBS 421]|uniref:Uncharacterized protein n=1 Tax=Naumovozyma dairenensis (strain ATCC 10597 / BCRC 20456 / CBS 421 / NBRC 0211 / NRRL Y-12639) TaxID=1071378 RepID=G0WCC2_NAUDC|nr:hypothetical protein NDAI_0F01140 [Naumovozyma dairenensis CBS 421]CCD25433.1 hypothetical protein NDAI_0F01140 [Naumovozyma dairenensis CBS 421]